VFVNLEDYRADVEEKLKEGPMYVCASYDTDLLAMNGLTGHADFWKELAALHPDLLVELRTKAAVEIKDNISNVIYAFTLSPEEVVSRYEKNTAPLKARISAAASAIENGSKVRLCFDPVIKIPGWKDAYKKLGHGFLLGSETASTVSSRGVYKFPVVEGKNKTYDDGQCSSYDLEACSWSNIPEYDCELQDDMPWVIGEFVWTGFDYLGEPTPYDGYWPSRSSYFGIFDF
jgi:hypothetical protein